ncbi:general secretion pathway protein GspF [Dokdonia pacifica]|uniref:Type IV pilus assembly protein PilC n=1 Tax=Dokdonia pacifica TaxID=1627892 RepID=A0A239E7I6_9FLAO|nr:type II secretion system F family protein [Dokdonia pacifica]GGG25135.1 general secretion pathway protein GspF [Dokdonia pacifica]SNS39963.1 type IV pilus assembly protein PilC [Dokdonia pacifica]
MGLKVKDIKKEKLSENSESSLDTILKKEITLFGNSFGSKKKEQFYTELSVLLKSGIRLKDALYLISESQKKKEDTELFLGIGNRIIAGDDFSKILKEHTYFSTYEEHSVRIGEESGALEKVTASLADFYKRKNEQRRNIKNALTYPVFLLITAFLAVTFMLRFVVPIFQDMFRQNDVDLPVITQSVISISEWIGTYGWLFLVVILLFIIFQKQLAKKKWYRSKRDIFLMRLPLIGSFVKTSNIARFLQAVSLLVSTKVSIPQSIHLAKEMIDFYPLEKDLEKVEEDIQKGRNLSDSLKEYPLFDNKMVALVRVAEETNKTEFVFQRLSEQYNEEVLQKSKTFSTLLEPIIILVVGFIIGVILISMYLPMFEIGNVLK